MTKNDKKENRRNFIQNNAFILATPFLVSGEANADDGVEGETIAQKAARISLSLKDQEDNNRFAPPSMSQGSSASPSAVVGSAYDYELPVAGKSIKFEELIGQNPEHDKIKAVLVVGIKQDDPIARRNIPELISLAAKYGQKGFAVICIPTDQGYYEPDTSTLIRLKMASEYGYGINPATVLTDKVNYLGTGAHPFMRWIQGNCRTPAGLGKIQGNFEKFLVDATTGKPIRRYPRKYDPYKITNDIEDLLGKDSEDFILRPPIANFYEEWRAAAKDAEADTYRFQKGLNVFDQ